MLTKSFSNKIVNFTGNNPERLQFFEQFRDFFYDYVYHDASKRVGKNIGLAMFDSSMSLDEKSTIIHQRFVEEVCKYAGFDYNSIIGNGELSVGQWATNPTLKWALHAVSNAMIDAVLPDILKASDASMYTDYRFIDDGDSASFDVESRDLFLVTKSGRNKRHQEAHKQFRGQVTVDPVEHDVTVFVQLYRVLAGKENLGEYVIKAILSIEHQMAIDAYSAFDTAFDGLSAISDLYYSGYTDTNAITLAQTVSAWNNAPAMFVGTKLALKNILPTDANYRYTLESDYARLGYVQMSNGYGVLELPQRADWRTEFNLALDNDKIYCISPGQDKLIKQVIQGDTIAVSDMVYQNADLTQKTTLKKSWGQALCTAGVYGCITLS